MLIIGLAATILKFIAFPANVVVAEAPQQYAKKYHEKVYEKGHETYCKLGCPQGTDHFIVQTNCNLIDYNSEKEIKRKAFRGQVYKIIPPPIDLKNHELIAIQENIRFNNSKSKNIRNKTTKSFIEQNNINANTNNINSNNNANNNINGITTDIRDSNNNNSNYEDKDDNFKSNNNIYLINRSCGEIHNFKLLFNEKHCSSSHNLPEKPVLNKIDREFLKICGAWGQRVTRASLEDLLNNLEVFNLIHEALEGELITKASSKETFKQELLDIWMKNKGFEHVFCGQPDPGRNLGGMHYLGRYLQMQENGWGGLNECCNKNLIEPPIYTIGIEYVTRIGNIKTKCPNGYLYDTEAINLLIEASKAFKKSLSFNPNKKRICNYQIRLITAQIKGSAQETGYNMRLIRSAEGIITFYSTNHDECLKAIEGGAAPEAQTSNCYC